MAFHVACPITCRRICFCSLGFHRSLQSAKAKNGFLEEVSKVEEFVKDPWGIRAREITDATVEVAVPKVVPPPPPPPPLQPQPPSVVAVADAYGVVDGVEETAAAVSAQTKRAALQREAAEAMVVAEDYARRFESGEVDASTGEELGQPNVNVMCRICFFGDNEGSERARKMLSCKNCGKKYHRSCLKTWAQHRDLFHWSSWTCPSCRTCEICRRTGDPNKFMFCKRCDGAYHCYCQHPPHKNVSSGPYLCPKHRRCHSCGSNVPGNGLSVRWFLSYTCCDACGRLFTKGNYCPVCLKVYRDSESTPMVCCDVCQRWVHCHCDGISDDKYLEFQVNRNLQYTCATCRGECYKVKDMDDAVQELWRRRDKDDHNLIISLRAAAGLPTQEEIFSISPYSDDDENGPVILKSEFGRAVKLTLKGVVDKSPKKVKDSGKKYSNKKLAKKKGFETILTGGAYINQSFEEHNDAPSFGNSLGVDKNEDMVCHRNEGPDISSSSVGGSLSQNEGICSINQPGVLKHKFVDEVMVSDEDKASTVFQIKSNNSSHGLDSGDDAGKNYVQSKAVKRKKLVINLGARKINVTNLPKPDSSNCLGEQELLTSNGVTGDEVDHSGQSKGFKIGGTEKNVIKLGKITPEASDSKINKGTSAVGRITFAPEDTRVYSRKKNVSSNSAIVRSLGEVPSVRADKVLPVKQLESKTDIPSEANDDSGQAPVLQSMPKDLKPLLKFKFKKPISDSQNFHPEEEKSSIKGQRSKRKRPSSLTEKTSFNEDQYVTPSNRDNLMEMDASWILQKLGKDAIGKRVEVHQPSDNLWHKGVVSDVIDGASSLSVSLDDGGVKKMELGGKQGIRFVPQKHKRSKS